MEDYPRTLSEFKEKFSSEEACRDYLFRLRWPLGLLKRWILGTHQGAISHDHLDYYLDEYTCRFDRRTSGSRGKLFYRLVQQAAAIEPAPYKAIIETVKRKKCLYKI